MLLFFILYVIPTFFKIVYIIPCIYLAHLAIIKAAFCQPKKVGPNEVWVLSLFSTIALDFQRSLFVITTKNAKLAMDKPFDVNSITKLWRTFTSSLIFKVKIPKYIKLAKLVVVHVIGFVEDEHCLSTLTFIKAKPWNRLTMHLKLVICMFNQKFFTLKTFPFCASIQN